jgi:hypothetical protein
MYVFVNLSKDYRLANASDGDVEFIHPHQIWTNCSPRMSVCVRFAAREPNEANKGILSVFTQVKYFNFYE